MDEEPVVLDGRYELRARIGSGGMADVYLGWDRRLEREVAIKWLRADAAAEPGGAERFRREALALAAVESPYVVGVHDVGAAGDYLVLRRATGPTLAELVATVGPLPVAQGIRIVAQVLEGLTDLHAHRILHRDVKPANIVIERRDRAVLLDLGVALDRRRPQLTPAGSIAGTPGYMAPEQERRRNVDERTDLYQVGLLLQHALTGDRAEVPIPAPVAAVIHRALATSPPERFLSSEEMRLALLETLGDLPTSDPQDPGPRDTPPEDPPTLVGRPTRS